MATGEKIKALRKKLGMTADQLGELIGRCRLFITFRTTQKSSIVRAPLRKPHQSKTT